MCNWNNICLVIMWYVSVCDNVWDISDVCVSLCLASGMCEVCMSPVCVLSMRFCVICSICVIYAW